MSYWWPSTPLGPTSQQISLTGIPSEEAFGALTARYLQAVSAVGGIASEEVFGNLSVNIFGVISGVGNIASAEAFGNLTLVTDIQISLVGLASGEMFGFATVVGAFTVIPNTYLKDVKVVVLIDVFDT